MPHRPVSIPRSPRETADEFKLSLLGTFQLTEGAVPLLLPGGSQRLLAFLGLRDRAVTRAAASGTLWPDAPEKLAYASLRSALSRLNQITRDALQVNVLDLSLAGDVTVDLRDSRALAHRLLIVDIQPAEPDMSQAAMASLSSDVLPDWYDEWALIETEKWHQLRLHALEALAGRLAAVGRFGDATEAALAVIAAEPLRESGYRALIRVHLAEGNQSEALGTFARYALRLWAELHLEPTPQLRALIEHLQPG